MNVVIEAIPSEDTHLFSYLAFEYDKELLGDIHENLTSIKKDSQLVFKMEDGFLKCTEGGFESIRRRVSIPEVEKNKYYIKLNTFQKTPCTFDLIDCKLNIDNGFFFFSGMTIKNKKKLEYQSVNFDRIVLEKLIKEG
jgi:hypothetical protein